MLEDNTFNLVEQLKPRLLAKLQQPDLDCNVAKIPIKLPKNLQECETDRLHWGAGYIARRCKVV